MATSKELNMEAESRQSLQTDPPLEIFLFESQWVVESTLKSWD